MALLTVSSGGLPVGNYTGTFAGIEVHPENKEKGYAAGIRWKFTITGGSYAGQVATRITSSTPTPKNNCGKILSGLLGRALTEGEKVDPDQFVGYMLVVAPGQNGGTRVEAIVPMTAT